MPAFDYVALNLEGKKSKGTLEADSEASVRNQLRGLGLIPFKVTLVSEAGLSKNILSFKGGMSVKERALIFRQLATFIGSGLHLSDALEGVAEQAGRGRALSIIKGVRSSVLEGISLADSLAQYPKAFPAMYCQGVRAAEETGQLSYILQELANYSERVQKQQQKIQMALVYPMLLTFIAISVVVFLLTKVMPDIVEVFLKQGGELPALTQSLIVVSEFFQHYGLGLGITLLTAFFTFIQSLKIPRIKRSNDQLILKLPLAKQIISSRYLSTLALLTRSGVTIDRAMLIASDVVGNDEAKQRLNTARDAVKEGQTVVSAFKATGLFSTMMIRLIDSGEKGGELDEMFSRCATEQEERTSSIISVAITLFEPLMLLVMGGVVLLIVLSIILPIMDMNTLVG